MIGGNGISIYIIFVSRNVYTTLLYRSLTMHWYYIFTICIPLATINESYFWAFQIILSMKFGVGYFIHEQILHYYNAMFI